MSLDAGRRQLATAFPPSGVAQGAIPYVNAAGHTAWLAYPAGAALGEYVLVTSDDDIPTWALATSISAGSPVTVDDGSGGFLLVFDENGNVVTV